jgi:hypothetical protein
MDDLFAMEMWTKIATSSWTKAELDPADATSANSTRQRQRHLHRVESTPPLSLRRLLSSKVAHLPLFS